ncbi:unnamed protein product [Debaryomyces fabryi]|nr:unnamed protein product [Debaryomyces fabryi]
MGVFTKILRLSVRFQSSISKLKQDSYYKMSSNVLNPIHGQDHSSYFGAEIVNRVSFLREDGDFISNSVAHDSTRFIFFDKTNPLINKDGGEKLIMLTNGDNQLGAKESVKKGILSLESWQNTVEEWSSGNKDQDPELRDNNKPTFLFLGLEDESVGLNLLSLKSVEDPDNGAEEKFLDFQGRYQGIPYYAVDLSQSPELQSTIINHVSEANGIDKANLIFSHSRKHYLGFSPKEAALYSHGKMFLDWLSRNRFCPGCGSKVIPIHAGGKLKCTNEKTEGKNENDEIQYTCPVRNATVSNVSFPRTDAVVITAITNTDRSKVLLSLAKRYAHTKLYACTAGFMEPSETVEVATKREIWEETGVVCSDINIVLTQPWPFPGNLMIGCLAVVEFNGVNEVIHLGHDRELADARWFDVEFIKTLIYGTNDHASNPEGLLLPSKESIAFLLIKMVIDQASDSSEPSNKL